MYTTGQARIQYFNLYCLYKTFIFKLYNGIIEIHRIFYSVFQCTHCENNTFIKTGILMSKCFKYMHFFALQYYVTLKKQNINILFFAPHQNLLIQSSLGHLGCSLL